MGFTGLPPPLTNQRNRRTDAPLTSVEVVWSVRLKRVAAVIVLIIVLFTLLRLLFDAIL